jgi:acid phosphatase
LNQPHRPGRNVFRGFAGFLLGLGVATVLPLAGQAPVGPAPAALAPFAAESPRHRGLDASLYMQTAAEYRACCYQAYNLATRRLRELHDGGKGDGPRHAVVVDLDETVLDNSGFEAMLARSGLTFDQRLWELWQEKGGDHVALLPGALEFLQEADKLKVDVFAISNRDEKYRAETTKMLTRLGIAPADAKHLKLKTAASSDKTTRRKEVEDKYAVLLYLGDNLRDFDEEFKFAVKNTAAPAELEAAIRDRNDKVAKARAKWGDKWIILPNPVYGEWTAPLGLGDKDLDRLVPAAARKP